MSDIVTRLLLKTNDFDANLNKSKQSVNSFQNGIASTVQTAGAGVAKFAGAIGMAIGAGEGLMKVIQGSQATNDLFDNTMNACKDSVDAFFIALSTGDFSAFENGLIGLFNKANDLSSALDDIADKRLSIDLVDLRKQGEMTALEAIIRDTSKTKNERSDALAKYQALAKEVAANRVDIAQEELIGHTNVELNKIGVKNLSQDDVTVYLEKLNNKDLNQQFLKELKYVSNYTKSYNEAWEKVANYRNRNGADEKSFQMEREFNEQYETPDKWMKRAFPKSEFRDSKQLIDFGKLFQQNDKGRELLYEYTKRLYAAEYQNAADSRKFTKLKGSVNGTGGGKPTTENASLSGSLAYFDAEIAKKNKELINATTAQARAAVKIAIDELEAKKINLKIELDKDVFKSLYGEAKGSELKKAGLPTQGIDTKKINPFKTKSPISKKDIKLNEDYSDSLLGVADAFGTVGSMANQLGENWLAFAFNSMGSIGQMIMQLQSLATAQGVASAFALPFPANLGAIATVVSTVASIFGSLPAFENGGIVPGVSFTGDKVHALVNSGEMILNGGQQANLFRMLNSRIYGGITSDQVRPVMGNVSRYITPDESSREIKVSGTLRANGSVLETVLNNYAHKKSKVR